jgi:hypothetical protein
MLAKMISLENRHNELDGKISNLLKKPHANSQALIDIKSMFSKFLGTQKDELSSHSEISLHVLHVKRSKHHFMM